MSPRETDSTEQHKIATFLFIFILQQVSTKGEIRRYQFATRSEQKHFVTKFILSNSDHFFTASAFGSAWMNLIELSRNDNQFNWESGGQNQKKGLFH